MHVWCLISRPRFTLEHVRKLKLLPLTLNRQIKWHHFCTQNIFNLTGTKFAIYQWNISKHTIDSLHIHYCHLVTCYKTSCRGVVDKPLALCTRIPSLIPRSSNLSGETLSQGPISIWPLWSNSYVYQQHAYVTEKIKITCLKFTLS